MEPKSKAKTGHARLNERAIGKVVEASRRLDGRQAGGGKGGPAHRLRRSTRPAFID